MEIKERIIQIAGPKQLKDRERLQAEKVKAEKEQQKAPVGALAAYVSKAWEAAVDAKVSSGVLDTLIECLNQRNGEYDDEMKSKLEEAGSSKVYMMLTSMKCRAGEAWVKDILLPADEKPWGLDPSPYIDLPADKLREIEQEVIQEAAIIMKQNGIEAVSLKQIRDRLNEIKENVQREEYKAAKAQCRRMETKIEDELRNGHYYEALGEFITDLMTFPTAFLKGPIIRKRPQLVWSRDENGDLVPEVVRKLVKEYDRVNPFDIFPSPGARSLQDGYLCERLRLRRRNLLDMKGAPGWSTKAIDAVLSDYPNGLRMYLAGDTRQAVAEGRSQEYNDPDPPIEGCLFNGPVRGEVLRNWGMTPDQVPDINEDYEIQAVLIGRWIVMARLNPHPLGRRQYYSASFEAVNDSVWGKSPAQLMRDTQRICNAAARAIVNNMGIASGPQVEVQFDRLMPGENAEAIWPWKIWKTKESLQPHGKPAINFFQPNILAGTLLNVYTYFFEQASEQTGIPAYVYGNQMATKGGAGQTASGLSMLMNAASKTLKNVVAHIDKHVIIPSIREHWLTLMLYDNTIDKTGDIEVIARASQYLFIQEQLQMRLSEFLDKTNNPVDQAIIGPERRASLLRETAKAHKLPVDDIVPTKQEMEERMRQIEQQQMPAQQGIVNPPQTGGSPEGGAAMAPDGGRVGHEPGRIITHA